MCCVQAIGIAACYPQDWPLLVICPSSMRLVWFDALINWLPAHVMPESTKDIAVIENGKASTNSGHFSASASQSVHPTSLHKNQGCFGRALLMIGTYITCPARV